MKEDRCPEEEQRVRNSADLSLVTRVPAWLYWGSLGLLWFLWWGFHSLEMLPFVSVLGYLLVRHRRHVLGWLVLTPVVLSWPLGMGMGTWDYFQGRAVLHGYRRQGLEAENLLREFRCGGSDLGSLRIGWEYSVGPPYNLAVTRLIRHLGYQEGSYDGPYPSREEALEALENRGRGATAEEARARSLRLEGREVSLLLSEETLRTDVARYAVVGDRCLLVQLPVKDLPGYSHRIALYDLLGRRSFATYWVKM